MLLSKYSKRQIESQYDTPAEPFLREGGGAEVHTWEEVDSRFRSLMNPSQGQFLRLDWPSLRLETSSF